MDAVQATQQACVYNDVYNVECIQSDGLQSPAIKTLQGYRLITCNILANIVVVIANDIASLQQEGDYCILSGMLQSQISVVLDVYKTLGYSVVKEYTQLEWATLVLQKGRV